MSSRLQLDKRNLSLGRRHLVNAYEVEAGIGVIAGNTSDISVLKFISVLVSLSFSVNHFYFYIISVLT